MGSLNIPGLSTLTDLFKAPDGSLDQTKKEMAEHLDQMKQAGQLGNAPITIKAEALKGFKKDLDELGATDEQKTKALTEFEAKYQEAVNPEMIREIANSPESQALDNFVNGLEQMKVIEELKANGGPKGGIEGLLSRIPGAKDAILMLGPLLGWAAIPEKGKEDSFFGRLYKTLAGNSADKKPEAPAPGTPEATQATTTAEKTAETVALTEAQKTALKPLTEGFPLDETKTGAEIKALNLDDKKLTELVTKATTAESNSMKVKTAVEEVLKEKKPTYRLSTIAKLEELTNAEIDKIIPLIKASTPQDETKMNAMLAKIDQVKTGDDEAKIKLAMGITETPAATPAEVKA